MKSKVVSLSAISAGFIAILLTVGAYIELADLFTVIVASVFVILPSYLSSYKGCILSALAGGLIAFLCSGFNVLSLVFPSFFSFFAFYPIVKLKMVEKRVRKATSIIIGIVWFLVVAVGCYYYYTLVMKGVFDGVPEWLMEYVIYFVIGISVLFFIIYDRFILVTKIMADRYLRRIIK